MKIGVWSQHSARGWTAGQAYSKVLVHSLRSVSADVSLLTHGSDNAKSLSSSGELCAPLKKYPSAFERLCRKASKTCRVGFVSSYFRKLELFLDKNGFDIVLGFDQPEELRFSRVRTSCWIPDLQEKSFPAFFTPEVIGQREEANRRKISWSDAVTVSSDAVGRDIVKWYGDLKPDLIRYRFPSIYAVDSFPTETPSEDVLARFGVSGPYFLVVNQFWMHKNHDVVLAAANRCKVKYGFPPQIVMIGNLIDTRDRNCQYLSRVLQQRSAFRLDDSVKILGFVSEDEKLALLRQCQALVQPSLCEGWNTSIEDAKALGVPVIASDIAVHREQLGASGLFFSPDDAACLAELFQDYRQMPHAYDKDRERSANDAYRIIAKTEAESYFNALKRIYARRIR